MATTVRNQRTEGSADGPEADALLAELAVQKGELVSQCEDLDVLVPSLIASVRRAVKT
ncbi:hypothetical protein ACIRJS_40035 [Streptomyces sp. NPDC102340]|uniref:hypothetical protein n=1 Tax=unclassified Streptomyces TaxID=2593676 RepID=UPI00380F6DE0